MGGDSGDKQEGAGLPVSGAVGASQAEGQQDDAADKRRKNDRREKRHKRKHKHKHARDKAEADAKAEATATAGSGEGGSSRDRKVVPVPSDPVGDSKGSSDSKGASEGGEVVGGSSAKGPSEGPSKGPSTEQSNVGNKAEEAKDEAKEGTTDASSKEENGGGGKAPTKVLSRDGGSGKGKKPAGLHSRKCTDVLFALVFVVFWLGMGIIALIGFATGDVRRLLFATDYLGNTCGTCKDDKEACGVNIYYPRPGLDALMQGLDPLTGLFPSGLGSVHYFGICVDECPRPGEFVCTYDVQAMLATAYRTAGARAFALQQCAQQMHGLSLGLKNDFGRDALSAPCNVYMRGCYFVTQPQSNLMWRCLPRSELNSTHAFSCFYPKFQDEAQSVAMPATVCPDEVGQARLSPRCSDAECFARTRSKCVPNDRCVSLLDHETRFSVAPSAGGQLSGALVAEQLGSWTNTVSRSFGDLKHTWWTVVVAGVLGGLVVGYLWVFILERTVRFFVYLMIALSLIALLLVILLCFTKAGKLGSQTTWLAAETGSAVVKSTFSAADGSQPLWMFFGVALSCVAIAYLLVLMVMRRKIQLAVRVLAEASRALGSLRSIMLLPVVTGLFVLITGLYGIGVFGYVYTAGYAAPQTLSADGIESGLAAGASDVVAAAMASSRSYAEGRRRRALAELAAAAPPNYELATVEQAAERVRLLASFNVTQTLELDIVSVVANSGTTAMMLYHVFGCLWTIQVITGVNLLTVSRAVSYWYWTKEGGAQPLLPVFRAYRRTLLQNFGTVCLGGLFIAVMQLIRLLVYYVTKHTERLAKNNSVIKVVRCVINACLKCFEYVLKYVTTLAYVMVGMHNCSFLTGAGKAITLIIANLGRLGTLHFVSRLITYLSIVVITMGCVALEIVWLDNDPRFLYGGESEINSPTLSVVLTGLISFYIATCFMQVYSITVDTILLCFCVDVELNSDTKEFYMGKHLRRSIFSRKHRKTGKKVGDQPSAKKNGSATVVPS